MDIIKVLYRDRVLAKSQEIAAREGLTRTFLASRKALVEVEKKLLPAEVLKVAKMTASWNSGHIKSESSKRL